ncbi:MAG: AEC family transporter [Bdellovibrionales bacterium]|nr:AEC family transporter [Bdellovibrionales bacterium]
MTYLLLLPVCLLAGFLLQRRRVWPDNASVVLNTYVIWISFPALMLTQVPNMLRKIEFTRELFIPALAAWIGFALAAVMILTLARKRNWNRATTGALILTAGLGNTSFVGFPLIEALYGNRGLQYALIVDQAGSFLVLSTLGMLVAGIYSGSKVSAASVVKGIVTFPPFIAALLALTLARTNALQSFAPLLERLSSTLVPLALVSVGCQLHFKRETLTRRLEELTLGLAVKLFAVPAVLALGLWLAGGSSLAGKISVLEMAMGPMITAAIVAGAFRLDSEIANLMVGVGTPLSILTVWLWHLAL